MTAEELESTVDYLAETPEALERLVDGLGDEERRYRPDGVEFSVLENVCHLLDIEREGYAVRINRLLKEDNPVLEDIDGSRLARERSYNTQDIGTALEAFRSARADNVRILKSLNSDQRERGGMLETVGPITLSSLLCMMREHDASHRKDILELRDRIRIEKAPEGGDRV
jgi:hypothetical protein